MKAIERNPYRILGVYVGVSNRELARQINVLRKYIAAEEELGDDYSFSRLDGLQRSVEDIDEAVSRNDTDADKVENALFWFWKGNDITDEVALAALSEGNEAEAVNIWRKVIVTGEVTDRNASAYHNLAVYNLWRGSRTRGFRDALFLLSSHHWDKVKAAVVDSTHSTSKQELQQLFLNVVSQEFEVDGIIEAIKDIDFEAKADFLKGIATTITNRIKAEIEKSAKARSENKTKADIAGIALYKATQADLKQLESIVGSTGFAYESIADRVSGELRQCSFVYFKAKQEVDSGDNYPERSEYLLTQALNVAVGDAMKKRIEEDLQELAKAKNQEINEAILALQTVADVYQQALDQINRQVRQTSLSLGWNQQIDYGKVAEAKRHAIKWNAVNEMLGEILTDTKIEKIRNCHDREQRKQFELLAQWLAKTSEQPYLINRALGRYFGREATSMSAPPPEGCYIATMVYRSYDHPQVVVLRGFRDKVLHRSLFGRSFVRFYYRYSPKLVERLKDNKRVNTIIRKFLDAFIEVIRK